MKVVAETLQGWLKGINNVTTKYTDDPGRDNNSNNGFGDDVFGMVLGYHADDFNRTNSKYNPSHSNLLSSVSSTPASRDPGVSLYNGNISSWTLKKDSVPSIVNTLYRKGFKYRYDQLNRLKKEDYAKHTYGGGWADTIAYDSRYTYDANGNIDTLKRNAYGSTYQMDDFKYRYTAGTNKLEHVDDAVSSGNYATDINDQSTNNYKYDAIGNLVEDAAENIDSIYWNPRGKVTGVLKNNGDSIGFAYDAAGNRVIKSVKTGNDIVITYYIRDAQGNIMSNYERTEAGSDYIYVQTEVPIYGSDRLGLQSRSNIVKSDADVLGSCTTCPVHTWTINPKKACGYFARDINKKVYELKDHLGNVHATVSDRKTSSNTAQQLSYTNYYAFGMEMVGKNYSSNSYRYGFNGKEKDDEIKGASGTSYDYGFRIYDPRLGRFLSVDPLTKEYPWYTPYQFAGNTPIEAVDIDGLEPGHTQQHDYLGTVPVDAKDNTVIQVSSAEQIITSNNFNPTGVVPPLSIGAPQMEKFGSDLSDIGLTMTLMGGATAGIGGGPLAALGAMVAIAGMGIEITAQAAQGNYGQAIVTAGMEIGGGKVVNKLSEVLPKEVKKAVVEAMVAAAQKAVENTVDMVYSFTKSSPAPPSSGPAPLPAAATYGSTAPAKAQTSTLEAPPKIVPGIPNL